MTKYKYKHESLYFKDEDIKLLDAVKDEAKRNNMTFSDYVKELIRLGREKGVYNLPESVKVVDQSGKINELEGKIEKIKGDMVRVTELKDSNFDWDSILKVLTTDTYTTETQIVKKMGKIKKGLFDDFDGDGKGTWHNEQYVDLWAADIQQKLCLRAEYYGDVEYKQNQGWRLCKK